MQWWGTPIFDHTTQLAASGYIPHDYVSTLASFSCERDFSHKRLISRFFPGGCGHHLSTEYLSMLRAVVLSVCFCLCWVMYFPVNRAVDHPIVLCESVSLVVITVVGMHSNYTWSMAVMFCMGYANSLALGASSLGLRDCIRHWLPCFNYTI